FNQLTERWFTPLHRFASRYLKDDEEANDVVQKACIKMYQNLDSLDNPEKFKPWAYRIVNHLCIDELRRAGRREFVSWNEEVHQSNNGEVELPSQAVEKNEQFRLVQQALLAIPDEQRVIVLLKEYEGLTFREIAEILDIPINTAKSRLYYGLSALRKKLKKWKVDL
ncbi:MAG: RNA polymerase sigma factor, partial [Balneolaceae bacterium]